MPPQHSRGVAHVENESLDRADAACVAAALLRLINSAKAAPDEPPRLVAIHPPRYVSLDLRFQVVLDFIIQIALDVAAPDERPPLERQ